MFFINYLHFSIIVLNASLCLTSSSQTLGCILESSGKFKKKPYGRATFLSILPGVGVWCWCVLKLLT